MKQSIRLVAILLVILATGWWAVAGCNRGWTKTSIPRKTVDEVTGIEGVTYEHSFVPGIDFLAVVVVGASLLAATTALRRKEI